MEKQIYYSIHSTSNIRFWIICDWIDSLLKTSLFIWQKLSLLQLRNIADINQRREWMCKALAPTKNDRFCLWRHFPGNQCFFSESFDVCEHFLFLIEAISSTVNNHSYCFLLKEKKKWNEIIWENRDGQWVHQLNINGIYHKEVSLMPLYNSNLTFSPISVFGWQKLLYL